MNKIFDFNNPVMRFLSRLGDLIVLNALFLVCSLPVVTLGASLAGMLKVAQGYVTGVEPGIFKTFFRGFRENFRQATVLWLILAAILGAMLLNFFYAAPLFGAAGKALRYATVIVTVLVAAAASYAFPLIVRYDNSLKVHIVNAFSLAVAKLPQTVLLVALNALPVIILCLSLPVFLYTIGVWVLIGFGGICFLDCLILRPVLRMLEQPAEDGGEKN